MAKYRVFHRTEQSKDIYHHEVNEDRYMFAEYGLMNDEKLTLLVVADGMGGLSDGAVASHYAIKGFMQSIYENILELYLESDNENFSLTYYADELKKMVVTAIIEANKAVCDNAEPFVETGTTLSVVAILGGLAIVANTGDSPVYFYRSETGEFSIVSKLHTVAEQDADVGVYERYSDEYYANDHIIYKSLGNQEQLQEEDVYVKVVGYLQSGDIFLIGSDGAFGRMREQEILDIVQQEKETLVLRALFEQARKDKDDDQTAILYKVY